ncbi:hypothetical protein AVHY2522_13350 [Acidovorax sp. SUPP2522]|uniref:Rap1a/Tai family immunity protein n=1 Tax=unclassified Acidovorax TaxID=2684926 RepID=UPI00234A5263|nr:MULTISPECIES: Rap1a/Tai family immunity protein [unclassified Acidovorax]WCM96321.1 hypothetical protein M5C96_18035 [Acidovorax sp. GBBC 1281]GKT16904.1 hypothetical protein AVHY2522_13350 [Acidovorax sp. SUPP2522]
MATAAGLAGGAAFAQAMPPRLSAPLPTTQNAMINNTQITTDDFRQAYVSPAPQVRQQAELYLTGVLDATEGRAWCGYPTLKTITIDERLFTELKKVEGPALQQRASKTLVAILSKQFPCRSPR